MPISPENAKLYPKNWKTEVVPRIRARSGNQCECEGECGLAHIKSRFDGRQVDIHPDRISPDAERMRCTAENGKAHPATGSLVVLTVGHLFHKPEDCRDEVLKHWCQRCHLRYDRTHHQINARATRDRKAGQERMDI